MSDNMNWRDAIAEEVKHNDDNLDDLVCTLTDDELDEKFDGGFGGSEGKPFTAWTKDFVYFPVVYDGAEWVGSVPRNPCNIASCHKGGE